MPGIWAKGCVFDDCVSVIRLDMTTLIDGGRKSWYIIIIIMYVVCIVRRVNYNLFVFEMLKDHSSDPS